MARRNKIGRMGPPPKPDSVCAYGRSSVMIDHPTREGLKYLAKQEGLSQSMYLRHIVKVRLSRIKDDAKRPTFEDLLRLYSKRYQKDRLVKSEGEGIDAESKL
jgi:hypothetical protein